ARPTGRGWRRAAGARSDEDGTQHSRSRSRHSEGNLLRRRRADRRGHAAGGNGGNAMSLPASVNLAEVAARDGLQNEAQPVSNGDKIRLIDDLSNADRKSDV